MSGNMDPKRVNIYLQNMSAEAIKPQQDIAVPIKTSVPEEGPNCNSRLQREREAALKLAEGGGGEKNFKDAASRDEDLYDLDLEDAHKRDAEIRGREIASKKILVWLARYLLLLGLKFIVDCGIVSFRYLAVISFFVTAISAIVAIIIADE